MTRLSLRLRLTLVFAAVMAVLLVTVAIFLHIRLGAELDEQLEHRLRVSVATLQSVVGDGSAEIPDGALAEEEVVQVIDGDGRVVAATATVGGRPLLDEQDLVVARSGGLLVERSGVLDDDPVLLLAESIEPGGRAVVVVGASLESRDDAVNGLLTQLLIGIPAALLLASLAGYALAGAALRPVEKMRERAETISAEDPGARLPLPRAQDELHRLGLTLNEMLARLEDGLERERRFVADASHELRTPLASLRTELDLALRRPRASTELEAALRSASEEADRLARLADDLLVLARADAGKLGLGASQLAADELLGSVAERFAEAAAAAGADVVVAGSDGIVLSGDRLRLEQALGNVVDNALRYGGGAVELTARQQNGDVVLGVRDHGSGFPPEFVPHALERFTRADEARAGSSAGLGLAIVDAVAKAHGGRVIASNADGGGAVVELVLPAR